MNRLATVFFCTHKKNSREKNSGGIMDVIGAE